MGIDLNIDWIENLIEFQFRNQTWNQRAVQWFKRYLINFFFNLDQSIWYINVRGIKIKPKKISQLKLSQLKSSQSEVWVEFFQQNSLQIQFTLKEKEDKKSLKSTESSDAFQRLSLIEVFKYKKYIKITISS